MNDPHDRTQTFARSVAVARCPDCRQVRGPKHAEICPGPFQRIAPPPPEPAACSCPPGAWHDPGCYLLTEGDAA